MEPRIQYAQTTDGVSIAFWPLGKRMPENKERLGLGRRIQEVVVLPGPFSGSELSR
jgi:hypothetical protein